MPREERLKFLKKMIILGPKTAILGPQFCRILVLGPHFWWSGGPWPLGTPWIHPCFVKIHNIQMLFMCYYLQLSMAWGSMHLCVDIPQLCSPIQTNLKGSSMDN